MRIKKICQVTLTILFFILFVAPVLLLAAKSIGTGWVWPLVLPTEWDFRAWNVIVSDPQVIQSINTTVILGALVVIFNILLALPTAFSLSRYHFRGKSFIEAFLLMPILIPVLAIAMGIHFTMIKLGLADNMLGVLIIHMLPTLPYSIRMLKAGFDRLDTSWSEQASTLGASKRDQLLSVTIPLLLPSLKSTALLVFVISLSQYVLTAIIGGGNVTTLSMLYYPYFNSADEAIIASFSVVFALLPLLFLLVLEVLAQLYVKAMTRA
ncbi:ABC transporter permease [Bacillus salinus]|uniref:ABC transporter permease n=1 Tax=Bacillus sp. HMF5848 TaxID=2495421 RepID=UPI0021ADB1C3|nr:ABC transporter permease subunit [Bacillus sp. HMF5848]